MRLTLAVLRACTAGGVVSQALRSECAGYLLDVADRTKMHVVVLSLCVACFLDVCFGELSVLLTLDSFLFRDTDSSADKRHFDRPAAKVLMSRALEAYAHWGLNELSNRTAQPLTRPQLVAMVDGLPRLAKAAAFAGRTELIATYAANMEAIAKSNAIAEAPAAPPCPSFLSGNEATDGTSAGAIASSQVDDSTVYPDGDGTESDDVLG